MSNSDRSYRNEFKRQQSLQKRKDAAEKRKSDLFEKQLYNKKRPKKKAMKSNSLDENL